MGKRKVIILVFGVVMAACLLLLWNNPGSTAQADQLRTAERKLEDKRLMHIHVQNEGILSGDQRVDFLALDKEVRDAFQVGRYDEVVIHLSPEVPGKQFDEVKRLMHELNIKFVVEEN